MKTLFTRSYPINTHMLPLDKMLERLGLVQKIPEEDRRRRYVARLKSRLNAFNVLADIPAPEMALVAQGKKRIGDVIVSANLTQAVLDAELDRLNRLEGEKLEHELDDMGVLERIPTKERGEIIGSGMFPSPVLRHLNLTGVVLSTALERLNDLDGGREKMILKESPTCPFKLSSLHIPRFYDALGSTYRGTIHASEVVDVICFNEQISTKDVVSYSETNRLWLGDIRYLLALAAEHTDLVLETDYGQPLVSIGSEVDGGVPTFGMSTRGITLTEAFFSGGKWPPKARFITVPKHD